jgi:hypothetical protein
VLSVEEWSNGGCVPTACGPGLLEGTVLYCKKIMKHTITINFPRIQSHKNVIYGIEIYK